MKRKTSNAASESGNEYETEARDLEEALEDIPYEILMKAEKKTKRIEGKGSDKIGAKKKLTLKRHREREAEDAPRERDAKKPITSTDKVIFQTKKVKSIDPRYSEVPLDSFQQKKFYENFSFLTEMKQNENKEMAKQMRELRKRGYEDEVNQIRQAIGRNKAYVKKFNKDKLQIDSFYEIREEGKAEGKKIKGADMKRALQERIKEKIMLKNSKK